MPPTNEAIKEAHTGPGKNTGRGRTLKKRFQILIRWAKILTPGLAVLALLSIMVLGSNALVSEANGGTTQIDASVLDIPDVDAAKALVRCRKSSTTGFTAFCTRAGAGGIGCPAGLYSVTANGPAASFGEIQCRVDTTTVFSIHCDVASPCRMSDEFTGDPGGRVVCFVSKGGSSNRPASARCTVHATP